MKKVMFLASLLICGSTVFAQTLDFYSNDDPISDGATVTASEMDEFELIKAPIVVKNQGGSDVSAVLTVTLTNLEGDGGVGYCGWGGPGCASLVLNNPVSRTTVVAANSEMDPEVEAMSFMEGSAGRASFELTYGSVKKTIFVDFLYTSSIASSAKAEKDIVVVSNGGAADVTYSFDTDGLRVMNIYNVTGEQVASKVVTGLEGNLSFSLNKGIYLYSIVEKGKVAGTSKFVVK